MSTPAEFSAASALALLASHAEHASTVKATRAREQFFPLLESVVNDERCVVFVEHKDLPGRGMLVSERYQQYVRQLEATVRALLAPTAGPSFMLAGSVSVSANGDDLEASIASLRTDHAVRTAAKFDVR